MRPDLIRELAKLRAHQVATRLSATTAARGRRRERGS